ARTSPADGEGAGEPSAVGTPPAHVRDGDQTGPGRLAGASRVSHEARALRRREAEVTRAGGAAGDGTNRRTGIVVDAHMCASSIRMRASTGGAPAPRRPAGTPCFGAPAAARSLDSYVGEDRVAAAARSHACVEAIKDAAPA